MEKVKSHSTIIRRGSVRDKIGAFEKISSQGTSGLFKSSSCLAATSKFDSSRKSDLKENLKNLSPNVNSFTNNTLEKKVHGFLQRKLNKSNDHISFQANDSDGENNLYDAESDDFKNSRISGSNSRVSLYSSLTKSNAYYLDRQFKQEVNKIEEDINNLTSLSNIMKEFETSRFSPSNFIKLKRLFTEYSCIIKIDESLQLQYRKLEVENLSNERKLDKIFLEEHLSVIQDRIKTIEEEKHEFEKKKIRVCSLVPDPILIPDILNLVLLKLASIENLCRNYSRLMSESLNVKYHSKSFLLK